MTLKLSCRLISKENRSANEASVHWTVNVAVYVSCSILLTSMLLRYSQESVGRAGAILVISYDVSARVDPQGMRENGIRKIEGLKSVSCPHESMSDRLHVGVGTNE